MIYVPRQKVDTNKKYCFPAKMFLAIIPKSNANNHYRILLPHSNKLYPANARDVDRKITMIRFLHYFYLIIEAFCAFVGFYNRTEFI